MLKICPKTEHQHTLLWIHGLTQVPEDHQHLFNAPFFQNFKIVIPKAPIRYSTDKGKETTSWYDIKFRNQMTYIVPFDQAFSYEQAVQSFEKILKPIVLQESQILKKANTQGKFFVGGFSQGCAMSLHIFYEMNNIIDEVVAIGGSMFPFTPFKKTNSKVKIIHGDADQRRPWEYVKKTYEDKYEIGKEIKLLQKTGHQINENVQKVMTQFLSQKVNENQAINNNQMF